MTFPPPPGERLNHSRCSEEKMGSHPASAEHLEHFLPATCWEVKLGSDSCCCLLLFATGFSSPSAGSVQLDGSDRERQERDLGSISRIRVIQGDADGCWNGSPGLRRSWASAQQNELSVGQALSSEFLTATTASDPRSPFLGHCLP